MSVQYAQFRVSLHSQAPIWTAAPLPADGRPRRYRQMMMPFAMMTNLQSKYSWVLDTISYDSLETLVDILKAGIIDPAIAKHDELRIIKARRPTIISGRDLLSKK